MSVRSIEAEVSIKSGVQAECTIGREVIVEVHDEVTLESLTVTANGSYAPAEGVDGFSDVTVSVPERVPVTESLSVTENGLYEPTEGVDGYDSVSVAVPDRLPVTESLTVTANGTYEPDSGVDGYDHVTVAVPERQPDIESLTVTANGTYTSVKDGYNPVAVAVPERQPITESLSVTQNGTYTPPAGIDGFSSVTVDVPSSTPTFTLIGQSTHVLSEYTNTSTAEVIDTEIDIKNTDYAYLLTVITCDGTKTNDADWGGLTIAIGSRYTTNRSYYNATSLWSKNGVSLLFSDMVRGNTSQGGYGVFVQNNTNNIKFARKAHATACPKLMAGTYTVKVYGLDSL